MDDFASTIYWLSVYVMCDATPQGLSYIIGDTVMATVCAHRIPNLSRFLGLLPYWEQYIMYNQYDTSYNPDPFEGLRETTIITDKTSVAVHRSKIRLELQFAIDRLESECGWVFIMCIFQNGVYIVTMTRPGVPPLILWGAPSDYPFPVRHIVMKLNMVKKEVTRTIVAGSETIDDCVTTEVSRVIVSGSELSTGNMTTFELPPTALKSEIRWHNDVERRRLEAYGPEYGCRTVSKDTTPMTVQRQNLIRICLSSY
jgi:hypothetical protein